MSDAPPPASRFVSIRNAFFSGALLLAPLGITIWAFQAVVDFIGGRFRPLFEFYLPASLQQFALLWDVVATIAVLFLVTLLGYISHYVFGKFFLRIIERFVLSIPGVGAVYSSVKQIVSTFGNSNRNLFNKVVLVEFPRKGVWTLGFLTSREQGEAQTRAGAEIWTVFVPTTPNPTSGFLLMLPRQEVVELEMGVGDGMKMIISGGAVVPPWPVHKTTELPK